ncbi:hypothetical protein, partial [Sphingomonas bacterium]|uniref:hypothetical protein n=1 Tax=Sphingomonas bacterium TaxID=1895847 RepID=UPI003F6897D8
MIAARLPALPSRFGHPAWWAMPVTALALALQARSSLDCDVSWLTTVAERVIDGATLYRDVEEVNPPASVLLYMPFVAVARALALPVEAVTVAIVAALAGLSIMRAGRLLDPPAGSRGRLAAAAAFVLLVLPADLFAQREHVALIAGLPMLALLVARAEGRPVGRIDAWTAGLGAGLMTVVKPHLLLSLLAVAGWAIARRRSIGRAAGAEWIALALSCAGYAAVLPLAFPLYLGGMLPLLRLVYLPDRDSWTHLLTGTMVAIPAVAAALTAWLARGRVAAPA